VNLTAGTLPSIASSELETLTGQGEALSAFAAAAGERPASPAQLEPSRTEQRSPSSCASAVPQPSELDRRMDNLRRRAPRFLEALAQGVSGDVAERLATPAELAAVRGELEHQALDRGAMSDPRLQELHAERPDIADAQAREQLALHTRCARLARRLRCPRLDRGRPIRARAPRREHLDREHEARPPPPTGLRNGNAAVPTAAIPTLDSTNPKLRQEERALRAG
jgi:hypothetical protein